MKNVVALVVSLAALGGCVETTGGVSFGSGWVGNTTRDAITGVSANNAILLLPSSDFSDQPSAISVSCEAGRDIYFTVISEGFWGGQYTPSNRKVWFRIDDQVFEARYLHDVEGDAAWIIHARDPRFQASNAHAILNALTAGTSVTVRVMDWQGATHTSSRRSIGSTAKLIEVLNQCRS